MEKVLLEKDGELRALEAQLQAQLEAERAESSQRVERELEVRPFKRFSSCRAVACN